MRYLSKSYLHRTQVGWDILYNARPALTTGLHIFNANKRVLRDGDSGLVLSRTALTAVIRWNNGTVETVDQFDKNIYATGAYDEP